MKLWSMTGWWGGDQIHGNPETPPHESGTVYCTAMRGDKKVWSCLVLLATFGLVKVEVPDTSLVHPRSHRPPGRRRHVSEKSTIF
jgi:hypothetical protein